MRQELGRVRSESEYFQQLDIELIEKMRQRADREGHQRRMAEACQIEDPNILDALERLGYSPKTVPLLCLVPLVQVAWADGWVTHAERNHVLAIAHMHGVEGNTVALQQLEAWLEWPPSEEFFLGSWRAIRAALDLLSQEERKTRQDALIAQCKDVASANWHLGKIGAAERKVLEEIQKQLEPHQQLAASAGVQR
jgi:tellurite resistance protein